jgi:predicted nuclease of restriction endonuclease-like (RecB) superfamily
MLGPAMAKKLTKASLQARPAGYELLLGDVARTIEQGRIAAARSVNAVMTATYWLVGQRIVEEEQQGRERARYGEMLLDRLAADLTSRFGRGFGRRNLFQMRAFYLAHREIVQTVSAQSPAGSEPEKVQTLSAQFLGMPPSLTSQFPLPWSHYVRLLAVQDELARSFYETEALRGGWSIRQLTRQIDSQFYERTALSRDKAKMLTKGARARPEDLVRPEDEIKEPYVLEFLGLKDEYSETDLEEALVRHLEAFLLELGGNFTFVGRQRRLRIGDAWYRVDLLFFHRRLRCLVVIDLKLGEFTHADAGQMHLYLNYAREHWVMPDENPPVGLVLCAKKDHAVAKYALEGLPNKVLAAEYRTALPEERILVEEIEKTRRQIEQRRKPARPA